MSAALLRSESQASTGPDFIPTEYPKPPSFPFYFWLPPATSTTPDPIIIWFKMQTLPHITHGLTTLLPTWHPPILSHPITTASTSKPIP